MLDAARNIAIKSPRAPQAADALARRSPISGVPEGRPIPLTAGERLERARRLLRDGDPQTALDELTALERTRRRPCAMPVQLNRGLALDQLRRYEESNKVLEPLAGGAFKYAIPAIYHAAKNYRALSASINPIVIKDHRAEAEGRNGEGARRKGKEEEHVTKPKYANVKKNDPARRSGEEGEEGRVRPPRHRAAEGSAAAPRDAAEVRLEVLNTLIGVAEAKNQDAYEQELVRRSSSSIRYADPALQHFWDKAWAAYARGDLQRREDAASASSPTPTRSPNVKRQADYWYARTDRARWAEGRRRRRSTRARVGAVRGPLRALRRSARRASTSAGDAIPLKTNRPDWRDIAEKNMPAELRLAYELTALSDMRDARAGDPEERQPRRTSRSPTRCSPTLQQQRQHAARCIGRCARVSAARHGRAGLRAAVLSARCTTRCSTRTRSGSTAEKNGVDPYLIMALIHQESYFNPRARSRVGATGLMQLMPATGKELGAAAARLQRHAARESRREHRARHVPLPQLIDLFGGNPQLAVASYNAGQGNVLKWRRAAPANRWTSSSNRSRSPRRGTT